MEFAPELQTLLTQMETDSDETINKIRDTVWAVNSENDSLDILIVKMHFFHVIYLIIRYLTFFLRIILLRINKQSWTLNGYWKMKQ